MSLHFTRARHAYLRKQNAKLADLNSKLDESQAKFAEEQQQIQALTASLEKVTQQVQANQSTIVAGNQNQGSVHRTLNFGRALFAFVALRPGAPVKLLASPA